MQFSFGSYKAVALVGLVAFGLFVSSLNATARDLKPLIDWVSDPAVGRPDSIPPIMFEQLKLTDSRTEMYQSLKKGYRVPSTGMRYSFHTVDIRGRREVILTRQLGDKQIVWNVTKDGRIASTILLEISDKTVERVSNISTRRSSKKP